MNDVVKKRVVGAGVLVILGIVLPLLLARCLHGGNAGNSEQMRAYEITPDGEAQPAGSPAASNNNAVADTQAPDNDRDSKADTPGGDSDRSSGAGSADKKEPPMPQAVSPSANELDTLASSGSESFDTPPVQDNTAGNQPSDQPSTTAAQASAKPSATGNPDQSANDAGNGNGNSLRRTPSQTRGWIVQVASLGDEDNAQRLASRLNGNYEAFYQAGEVNGKTWYRVGVGPYTSEAEAESAASRLRRQGRSTLVRRVP